VLGIAAALVLNAFQSNLVFFFTPTAGGGGRGAHRQDLPHRRHGQGGSLQRQPDGLTVRFIVTDTAKDIPSPTRASCPTCSSEGKGVVAQGKLGEDGLFTASEVLAKHDENYMPPEAQHAVDQAGQGRQDGQAMIPELGHFALILALLVALVQGTLPLAGAARGSRAWIALARPAAQAQFLLVAFAFGCLTWAFVANDFSVAYVAQHSNSRLPLEYRIAGVWGGHEGSLLLWLLMLSGWTVAVALFSRHLPDAMVARVLGVLGLVAVGFLRLHPAHLQPLRAPAAGGRGRPRPQPAAAGPGPDLPPAHALHGLRRLLGGLRLRHRGAALRPARRRLGALVAALDHAAWVFLTLGIALGSWWAYYELGWGGWWFWDPVENASFMPWLVGTALIHSLAVTEKRGSFKNWTVLLAIAAFSLSLLGTFLVRSGVLTSVHAFATDPRRGIFILIFLAIVVGASLFLFAWRAPKVGLGGRFGLVSRESLLLANNVLLVVATGAVLLGTLYPLFIDALGLGKLSVGPPYFNAVFVPLMVPLLFLMAPGPLARWKHAHEAGAEAARAGRVAALLLGVAVPLLYGGWSRSPRWACCSPPGSQAAPAWRSPGACAAGCPACRSRAAGGACTWRTSASPCSSSASRWSSYQEEKDVRMAPATR
jgi:cytochrome c-type biogenesis protein CcmE